MLKLFINNKYIAEIVSYEKNIKIDYQSNIVKNYSPEVKYEYFATDIQLQLKINKENIELLTKFLYKTSIQLSVLCNEEEYSKYFLIEGKLTAITLSNNNILLNDYINPISKIKYYYIYIKLIDCELTNIFFKKIIEKNNRNYRFDL